MTFRTPMTESCPDWHDLTAYRREDRREDSAAEPAAWQDSVDHLDHCPTCRQAAVQADPTLLFRRLPGPASEMSPGEEAAEVEAMRQAVAAMRTARRLEPPSERAVWRRWVAAAALAAAALSLGAGHGLRRDDTGSAGGRVALPRHAAALEAAAPSPILPIPQAASRFVSEPVPVVEELNRPAARVYQMDGGKNLSVVMIVDERFDV